MKPQVRIVLAIAAALLVGFVAWRIWGPGAAHPRRLSGYVEGETLYIGASIAGPVSTVSVQRGQRVAVGQPLFALDAAQLVAVRDQAASQAAAAQSQAQDAAKGQRPDELAVYDAQRAAAAAALAEVQADYNRIAPLAAKGIYAPARLDQARAALKTAQANVRTVEQQRRVGTLGARPDAIRAAESQAAAARDQLALAQDRLDQISPKAPAAPGCRTSSISPANGWRPTSRWWPCWPTTGCGCASTCPRPRSRSIGRERGSPSNATAARAAWAPGSISSAPGPSSRRR
jgi:HlyD family secretion protein